MKDVRIPIWGIIVLMCIIFVLALVSAVAWGRNNNLRINVAGIKNQLSGARSSQRELAGELDRIRDAYHRVEGELDSAAAELEASQNRVGELENELERGRESGAAIGAAVGRIGEWIERVEEANASAEG